MVLKILTKITKMDIKFSFIGILCQIWAFAMIDGAPLSPTLPILPSPGTCPNNLDIVAILDSSGSVQETWNSSVDHLEKFLSNFQIGDQQTRVSIIEISKVAKVVSPLDSGNSLGILYQLLEDLRLHPQNGQTFLEKGLQRAAEVFQGANPSRPVPKVLVTFTDGEPNDGNYAAWDGALRDLSNQGVTLFVVAVRKNSDLKGIDGLASRPSYLYIFDLDNSVGNGLYMKQSLSSAVCYTPRPVPAYANNGDQKNASDVLLPPVAMPYSHDKPPLVDSAQPSLGSVQLPPVSAQPPVGSVQPPPVSAQSPSPHVSAQPPVGSAHPQVVGLQPPSVIVQPPAGSLQSPPGSAQPSAGSVMPPAGIPPSTAGNALPAAQNTTLAGNKIQTTPGQQQTEPSISSPIHGVHHPETQESQPINLPAQSYPLSSSDQNKPLKNISRQQENTTTGLTAPPILFKGQQVSLVQGDKGQTTSSLPSEFQPPSQFGNGSSRPQEASSSQGQGQSPYSVPEVGLDESNVPNKVGNATIDHGVFKCNLTLKFLKCHRDMKINPRPLPVEIMNAENAPHPGDGKWKDFLPKFICDCANKAQNKHDFKFWTIGIQKYSKCFSGPDEGRYDEDGDAPDGSCQDENGKNCTASSDFCAGDDGVNAVFTVITPDHQQVKKIEYD